MKKAKHQENEDEIFFCPRFKISNLSLNTNLGKIVTSDIFQRQNEEIYIYKFVDFNKFSDIFKIFTEKKLIKDSFYNFAKNSLHIRNVFFPSTNSQVCNRSPTFFFNMLAIYSKTRSKRLADSLLHV